MLWVKSLHIVFMVTWFAGLFYLPRLFVYHAHGRGRGLARALQGDGAQALLGHHDARARCSPSCSASGCGSAGSGGASGWLHAKIALVALLVGYHLWCWRLLRDFAAERNAAQPRLVPLVQRIPGRRARSPRCSWLSSSRSDAFFATCPRGPGGAARRRSSLPWRRRTPVQVPGGVAFGGAWDVCYRANLWSRIASRVLWRVRAVRLRERRRTSTTRRKPSTGRSTFTVERTLRVNVTAQKSPLKSLEFATLRIKDAVCDRFRDAARQPARRRSRRARRAHACLSRGGEGHALPRHLGRAAVQARLAHGAAARRRCARTSPRASSCSSGWKPAEPLLDPMCGGGTLLVGGGGDGARPRAGREAQLRLREAERASIRRCGSRIKRTKRTVEPVEPRLYGSDTDPRRAADGAAQPRRGGRRALGEARAGRRPRARRARGERA